MGQCGPFTLPACSPQAIQSRDRIQLQYSQSLIEKDQYRKQVRGLEAERDELLTSLTSLEGAKALLEAQLQRVQGGPCLKVSGVRGTGFWWECWGPSRSCWPGLGTCRTWWVTSAPGVGLPGTRWEPSAGLRKMQVPGGNPWVLARALPWGQRPARLGGSSGAGQRTCRSGGAFRWGGRGLVHWDWKGARASPESLGLLPGH